MAFTLGKEGVAAWPVDLVSPDRARDAEGNLVTSRVMIRYRLLTRSELEAAKEAVTRSAMERITELRTGGSEVDMAKVLDGQRAAERAAEADLLARIVGWRDGDIADPDGNPIAYSPDIVRALLDDDANYTALLRGLHEASRGAPAKN